MVEVGTD